MAVGGVQTLRVVNLSQHVPADEQVAARSYLTSVDLLGYYPNSYLLNIL